MGVFNTVRGVANCPSCGHGVEVVAQFQYGDTWLHEYRIGDRLQWGGNQVGEPGAKRAIVDAWAEGCSWCGYQGDWRLHLIVENDILTALTPPSERYDFDWPWIRLFVVDEL